MSEPALALRHLQKSYGALTVTDDVTLTVPAGEFHAIIGPNGAGKTTLIHQISGTLPSDSGHVLLEGGDVTALDMPKRVHQGLVRSFQITSILPGFSALENVALAVQAVPEIQVVGDDRNVASRNGIGEGILNIRRVPAVSVCPHKEIRLLRDLGDLPCAGLSFLETLDPMTKCAKGFGTMCLSAIGNQEVT